MITKEEAKKEILSLEGVEISEGRLYLIDRIYDDFENRSCENCKFKYVVDSMCTECRCNESPIDYIDLDCFPSFSCNEWKAK